MSFLLVYRRTGFKCTWWTYQVKLSRMQHIKQVKDLEELTFSHHRVIGWDIIPEVVISPTADEVMKKFQRLYPCFQAKRFISGSAYGCLPSWYTGNRYVAKSVSSYAPDCVSDRPTGGTMMAVLTFTTSGCFIVLMSVTTTSSTSARNQAPRPIQPEPALCAC